MRLAPALLLLSTLTASSAQTPAPVSPATRTAVTQLVGNILVDGQAYSYDQHLADEIGPRLTGSANYVHAVAWTQQQFQTLGLANVHTEPWTIPAAWEPETPATGAILQPRRQSLHIYSMGWSPSTPESGVQGEVFLLKSFTPAALAADKDKIHASIILIDPAAFGEKFTFKAFYDDLSQLARLQPKALLMAGGPNGTETAEGLSFDGTLGAFPQAQIGKEDQLLIQRLLEKGPVTVEISFQNRVRKNVEVSNVVAEIPGSDPSAGIVIVGAHLDSWHPGTGAQDNGTGVASVLETARAIQSLHRPAHRTIRFILFGGEEEGLLGSNAYVKHHLADLPNIDAVLISDTGAEPAKGWYVMGRDDEQKALTDIEPLLAGLGSNHTSTNAQFIFQTDHAGFDLHGVPTLVLNTGLDKYFKLHHKASDTFDAVVQADLTQGAATTAVTAYAIADSAQPFAPHFTQAQVEDFLRKNDKLDDYNFLKSSGDLP